MDFFTNTTEEVIIQEEVQVKGKSLFELLNCIYMKTHTWKDLNESDKKNFSGYMTNRFISMIPAFIPAVSSISTLNLEDKELYTFYYKAIPKGKHYGKYIKSKIEKIDKELLDICVLYLELSKTEILEYIHLLNKIDPKHECISNLLQKYGVGKKEIKKKIKTLS